MADSTFVVVSYNKRKDAPCVINFEKYREKELIFMRIISGKNSYQWIIGQKINHDLFDANQIVKLEIYKIP